MRYNIYKYNIYTSYELHLIFLIAKEIGMMKRDTSLSKQNQIYDQLKEDIINGKYDGGTFLQEGDLCNAFNVSRTPVREALIRLSHDRYIELIPNRGAFIPQMTISDIKELYELRVANDGMAAFLFAGQATPEIIQEMEQSVAREETYLQEEDFVKVHQEEVFFHTLYVNHSGNRRLIDVIDSVSNQILRVMRISAEKRSQETLSVSLAHHKELIEAVKLHEPEKARAIIAAHWEDNKQSYIRRYLEGTLSNRL